VELEVHKLRQQLQTKSIYNFYVFAGEETGIMKIYLEQLSTVSGKPIERIDTLAECYNRIIKGSLIPISKLYVIQDDKSFISNEKLWKEVPLKLKNNLLVMIYTKIDKRTKFFKETTKEVEYVVFNPLTAALLSKYITSAVKLSNNAAIKLAEVCECSYNRCMIELDKLKSYIDYRESIGNYIDADKALDFLLSEGVIYQPIGDIAFKFIDAVMERNNIKKLEYFRIKVRDKKESQMLLLSLLYTNFRNLFMYQSLGPDPKEAGNKTGMSGFEIGMAKGRVNIYSLSELKRALDIIQGLEYGVKIGTIEEDITIDYFIAQVI